MKKTTKPLLIAVLTIILAVLAVLLFLQNDSYRETAQQIDKTNSQITYYRETIEKEQEQRQSMEQNDKNTLSQYQKDQEEYEKWNERNDALLSQLPQN